MHTLYPIHTTLQKESSCLVYKELKSGRNWLIKSLKKIFIDRKIPAAQRPQIPVVADGEGILGVYGIGVNMSRSAEQLPAVMIKREQIGG